ncbi:ribbon-helix-helix domain-containing protein [Stetteria hydrogenophila]
MVVSVEISGLLEERLRRLVDLGLYASVAEAVREAVRVFLRSLDLRDVAFNLYVHRDATLQYAAEFAGVTYEVMMDYMISRGVMPAVGVVSESDVEKLEPGVYVLDGLTLYTAYRSGLVEVMRDMRSEGYTFLAPSSLESFTFVLEAQRVREGFRAIRVVDFVEAPQPEGRLGGRLISRQEGEAVAYARERGAVLLSDDARTRAVAREAGVKALSLASVLVTQAPVLGDRLAELAYSYKGIPALLPDDLLQLHG